MNYLNQINTFTKKMYTIKLTPTQFKLIPSYQETYNIQFMESEHFLQPVGTPELNLPPMEIYFNSYFTIFKFLLLELKNIKPLIKLRFRNNLYFGLTQSDLI